MQPAALLDEAMRWRDALKESGGGGGAAPALLVCGDFNSDRTDAVVHLLLRGVVEPTHPDWATGLFTWLKSSGCIPTARRAAADLAQRLALEGDSDGSEAPAPPAAAPAEANGGGGGAARARAWAAAAKGGSSRRGGTRCARPCGCCATCGRPPTTAPPRAPRGARRRAPRRGARADGARLSGVCGVRPRRAHGKSPHDAPALVAAAQPLLDRATAELQAVLSRFEPYRGTESFNGFTGNLIRVAERAATPDAGGGGAPPDGLGVRLELPVALESAYGDHAAPTVATTAWPPASTGSSSTRRRSACAPPRRCLRLRRCSGTSRCPRRVSSDHVWLACDVE